MDFIGGCKGRWRRNKVAQQEDGGVVFNTKTLHQVDGSNRMHILSTTPAFAAFPFHAESQDQSSPRITPFPVVIESSASTTTAGSESLTRPSSPPNNSISTDKVPPTYKYTTNAPAPLKLGPETKKFFPESNTSPLRINKRIPTSPPMGTSQISPYSPPPLSLTLASPSSQQHPSSSTNDSPQGANATHTSPPAPSSATPNTPSRCPYHPRMIDVHQLMLKSELAFPYYKI